MSEDINYLLEKWVQNPKSESSRKQYLMALLQAGLKPVDYVDDHPDGVLPDHEAPEKQDTVLHRKLPGKILPGTFRMEVNNRLQVEGEDYALNHLAGEVVWLKSAEFGLDQEDYVFYQCQLSPV